MHHSITLEKSDMFVTQLDPGNTCYYCRVIVRGNNANSFPTDDKSRMLVGVGVFLASLKWVLEKVSPLPALFLNSIMSHSAEVTLAE